jgi:branched-chain amino acid transport system substrate-binding protein
MPRHRPRFAAALGLMLAAAPALAQKHYDRGADDTTIKIGNIMPYSGPASAYGVIGKTEEAYFRMINDQGGINGRKIVFISYDDGYSPPKTVEQARRLVENDEVLLIFQSLGTAANSAIMRYMNARKVPQLFVSTGATKFGEDPKAFPYTMGWQPNYRAEGLIYARYLLDTKPDARIAVLVQNDDYGKDLLRSLKAGLGDKAGTMVVAEAPFEVSEPTIDSQIVKLRASGADVLMTFGVPKFAAQAIRKVAELEWKPLHIVNNVSASVGAVLKPAGLENSRGVVTTAYLKDPTDKAWQDDPAMKQWHAFLDRYYPDADRTNANILYGYAVAQTLRYVLQQCGDDLTHDNIMRQAASMKNLENSLLIPGIRINTGPDDFFPIEQMQMARFDGEQWVRFGPVLSADPHD